MLNLNYPVDLTAAEEGGFVVTFPHVPEAITQGEDTADALKHAADALESALSFYTDEGKELPKAGKPKRGQPTVRPSALGSIKLSIYQAMREQGVKKSELARRLGWHMPQVDRLLDLMHASRIDQAEAALAALGHTLDVSVSAVSRRTNKAAREAAALAPARKSAKRFTPRRPRIGPSGRVSRLTRTRAS